MDPAFATTTLATIVGLICNFKQERKDSQDAKHEEFMEWLEYHHHEQIKDLLAHNYSLAAEVDGLLKQDTETILARLNGIDDVLAKILSHVEGFSGIARIIRPDSELSDQAVHILRSLVESGADGFDLVHQFGVPPELWLSSGGNINIPERRFLEDDLETLANLGLLRVEYGRNGMQTFGITREAMKLIELINQGN